MISFFWIIAFLTLLCVAALILWALIWWLRRSGADRRSPLTRNLLRNPGDSLRPQLEDLALDMLGLSCLLLIIPIVVYSIWITELHFGTARVTTFDGTSRVIFTLVALGFVSYRILIVMKRRRALFLGLDGEMAIGQELNQLMLKGYAVYHDFPADHFNIDHIVVAPGGVFAVETKARPKPVTEDGKASAEVVLTVPPFASPLGRTEASSSKQRDRRSGYRGGSRALSASRWRLNLSWRFQAGTSNVFSEGWCKSLVGATRNSSFDRATPGSRPRKCNESFIRSKRDVERLNHAGTHGGILQQTEAAEGRRRLPPEIAQNSRVRAAAGRSKINSGGGFSSSEKESSRRSANSPSSLPGITSCAMTVNGGTTAAVRSSSRAA